jgi:hypothetical protein
MTSMSKNISEKVKLSTVLKEVCLNREHLFHPERKEKESMFLNLSSKSFTDDSISGFTSEYKKVSKK